MRSRAMNSVSARSSCVPCGALVTSTSQSRTQPKPGMSGCGNSTCPASTNGATASYRWVLDPSVTGTPTSPGIVWRNVLMAAAPLAFASTSLSAAMGHLRVIVLICLTCSVNSRSEEHTSELQSRENLVCRLLLEKKKYLVQCTVQ